MELAKVIKIESFGNTALLLTALILTFSACISNDYKSDKTVSPTRRYYLITSVNRSDRSKNDYAYVMINLFDSIGQLKSTLNTRAGDASKWAVGWDNQKDTVVLFSGDIDNNAWAINGDLLVPIKMTKDLNKRASDLKGMKYNYK